MVSYLESVREREIKLLKDYGHTTQKSKELCFCCCLLSNSVQVPYGTSLQ
jgi:hypothetical protein